MEIILIGLAFFTSALTAVTAAGGGMLLISAMTLVMPVYFVIPLHAVTQLASNLSRAALSCHSIVWRVALPFTIGVLLGMPGALEVYSRFEMRFSALPLGIFVLLMVWIPPHRLQWRTYTESDAAQKSHLSWRTLVGRGAFAGLGFIQSFLTLFVGSSAPLNLPFLLQQRLRRDQLVATSAIMMTGVSAIKILIFTAVGFPFSAHAGLLCALVVAVFAGSWSGTRLRQRIPEQSFTRILKILLTLLALRLVLISLI
jgi:uncharacterized membrane protein YfcA